MDRTKLVSDAYKVVRDATVNSDLTPAEQVGVLELIKHEILTDGLHTVRAGAMNK